MEGEAVIVCGHRIYKEVWRSVIGQELSVLPEPNNRHDRRAVAIYIYILRSGALSDVFITCT